MSTPQKSRAKLKLVLQIHVENEAIQGRGPYYYFKI